MAKLLGRVVQSLDRAIDAIETVRESVIELQAAKREVTEELAELTPVEIPEKEE